MADVIDTEYEVSLKSHKYVTATVSVVLHHIHTTDTEQWILQQNNYL